MPPPLSTHRHIVLAVHHVPSRKWGALGISRREELMFKDLVFDSLADLILDFKQSYEKWWHQLLKARIGGRGRLLGRNVMGRSRCGCGFLPFVLWITLPGCFLACRPAV
jgi:hypothetical protein